MRLTMLLDMAADAFGDRVVVGRRDDGITAEEMRLRSISGAAAIQAAGADAVLYLAVNGPAFPVAMFAAARFRFRVKEQVRGPADRGLD